MENMLTQKNTRESQRNLKTAKMLREERVLCGSQKQKVADGAGAF